MTKIRQPLPVGAVFKSENGEEIHCIQAVFPICTSTSADAGPIQFIGTAFFLQHQGLFATAKHNMMDGGKPQKILFALHFLSNDIYVLRNIWKWVIHPTADIAIGMLTPATANGAQLTNRVLSLSPNEPKVGDMASTFALPKTKVERHEDHQAIHVDPTWHFGYIEKFFPNGRDRVFFPGPVYQTSIEIPGGASGGPVLDQHGMVIGVNSSGYDVSEGDENISFVTPITEVMTMRIPFLNVDLPNRRIRGPSVFELVECGQIGRGTAATPDPKDQAAHPAAPIAER